MDYVPVVALKPKIVKGITGVAINIAPGSVKHEQYHALYLCGCPSSSDVF